MVNARPRWLGIWQWKIESEKRVCRYQWRNAYCHLGFGESQERRGQGIPVVLHQKQRILLPAIKEDIRKLTEVQHQEGLPRQGEAWERTVVSQQREQTGTIKDVHGRDITTVEITVFGGSSVDVCHLDVLCHS